jgi:16S rRNA (cytosine1402-N4)-methyltransferase
MSFHHIPVLADQLIAGLEIKPGGNYLDCTVGGGGHSFLILEAAKDIQLMAIDRDLVAIAAAQEKLQAYANQVKFWHGNFSDYIPPQGMLFDGVIADLGVSSAQLDNCDRGFSFRESGALDMRMDGSQETTAADIINYSGETELANLIYKFGEEKLSRRIARTIIEQRPFQTTTQLAEAISRCVPKSYRYGRIHPATRVFQALRIAVNQELSALEKFLAQAPTWLKVGGKLGVISFHSLEDRPVKHTLRQDERLQVITKKPIVPTEVEMSANPRSRSAKLRFAQRI